MTTEDIDLSEYDPIWPMFRERGWTEEWIADVRKLVVAYEVAVALEDECAWVGDELGAARARQQQDDLVAAVEAKGGKR